MLEVEGLSITLPTRLGSFQAVRDVSFSLEEGETLGVVGESGCGKSLTSLALMGLLPPKAIVTAKKLRFLGQDMLQLSEKQRRALRGPMSMIFQDPMSGLNPSLTIGLQLTETLKVHRQLSSKECWREAVLLLEKVGIPDAPMRMKAYPHQLSGGMCQRVMIAMSLCSQPRLLIADEPTTALDVTIQAQILALLKSLQAEYRMGLLLISHNIALVAQSADRIQIMYAGEIVETGPVGEVLAHPLHPYTQGLLNSLPERHHLTAHPWVAPGQKRPRLPSVVGMVPDLHNRPGGCQFHPRCPYQQPACRTQFPQLGEWGDDPSRQVRCFFPLVGNAPTRSPEESPEGYKSAGPS